MSRADATAINDYAESTMRQLLQLYGLPRDAPELALATGQSLTLSAPFSLDRYYPFTGFLSPYCWGAGNVVSLVRV